MKQKDHLPFFGIGPYYAAFIFWALMAVMMKVTEEKWLHNLYGAEYDAYCRRVNRVWPWFPRK